MIIDIKDLSKYDVALSGIHYTYNHIRLPRLIEVQQKRAVFIYVFSGSIGFEVDGQLESFGADSLIYFPHGYYRKMTIESSPTRYCRIDLDLRINGEIALFSNRPTKIEDFSTSALKAAIYELRDAYHADQNKLLRHEKMLKLLSVLASPKPKPITPKLKVALEYINAHYTEKIDFRKLAAMCYLSTAQFYNLFNENLGQTPLQYKNTLLINAARLALSSNESTVAEVAEELGFSDAAYFSRFFKKQFGISPSKYHARYSDY